MKATIKLVVGLLCIFALTGVSRVQGSEPSWLQWGGPDRNFHLESASLSTAWPEGGPKRVWSRPLGEGYSAIVVDGGALYTMYRDGDDEVIVALDADSGETRWRHAYRAPFPDNSVYDYWRSQAGPGPYATPLIAGTRLFAVGVGGQFHALDRKSGNVLWSHDLLEDFDIAAFQGYAPSPIAYGANVILPVGAPGQAVVAFDQETGRVTWESQDLMMAPSSPILIVVDGQKQLVVLGRKQLAGLDPRDGALLWSHPHETEYGLNISTPVWGDGNLLFCSSAYNGGSRVIRLRRVDGATRVEELWFNNRMRIHFGNALRVGDLVLGTSGDFGPAFFTALDVETGEEVWRERSFARSHMVYAGGKIVIVDEDGEVAVATPTDTGLKVHARAGVLKENAWTPPTLVGSRLYVRDRTNIMALELGEQASR
jgi:outer membrane protein assembly factor BamB